MDSLVRIFWHCRETYRVEVKAVTIDRTSSEVPNVFYAAILLTKFWGNFLLQIFLMAIILNTDFDRQMKFKKIKINNLILLGEGGFLHHSTEN